MLIQALNKWVYICIRLSSRCLSISIIIRVVCYLNKISSGEWRSLNLWYHHVTCVSRYFEKWRQYHCDYCEVVEAINFSSNLISVVQLCPLQWTFYWPGLRSSRLLTCSTQSWLCHLKAQRLTDSVDGHAKNTCCWIPYIQFLVVSN